MLTTQTAFPFLLAFPRAARLDAARACTQIRRNHDWNRQYGPHGSWRTPNGACPLAALLTNVGISTTAAPGADYLSHFICAYLDHVGARYSREQVQEQVIAFIQQVDRGYTHNLVALMVPDGALPVTPPFDIVRAAAEIAAAVTPLTPEDFLIEQMARVALAPPPASLATHTLAVV